MGITTSHDSPVCKEESGMNGYWHPIKGHFVVCLDNVKSPEILYRTIRHEALHVAQTCNAGVLWPVDVHRNLVRAQDEGWHILGYPEELWDGEAEARVMSNELDAHEILEVIKEHCNH